MKNFFIFINKVLYLIGKDIKKIPGMIFLFLISSALDLIGIGLIGYYISLVINPNQINNSKLEFILNLINISVYQNNILIIIGLILVGLFLIKGIAAIIINWLIIKFSANRQIYLQSYLMKAYQQMPYIRYIQRNSAEYIQSIQIIVAQFVSNVLQLLLRLVSEGLVAVVLIVFLTLTNVFAVGVLILLLGIIFLIYDKLFRKSIKYYGELANKGSEEIVKSIHEGIGGFKEIRILGKEHYFLDKVEKGAKKNTGYNAKANIITTSTRYILEFVLIIFIVILVVGFSVIGVNIKDLVPVFGMFAVASLRLMPFAILLLSGISKIRFGFYATNRMYSDLKEIESFSNKGEIYIPKKLNIKPFSTLKLENISFHYPNTEVLALDNLNFSINSGDSIGIIGPSGSGKTTLVDVLLGVLQPQKGKIYYNNKLTEDLLEDWRSQVAYLPQEIFLIDNTIRCNIALGISEEYIDDKKVFEAIRQARLTSLIKELPKGLDAELGERGIRLSGGQRQRIALARAFYHERSILVLDEATSALDNETEKEIVDEIKLLKGQKTIIVIAHRLSTVEHCNCIYRLEKGKIIDKGSYNKVVGNKK